jgi:hypothetical protein
VIRRVLLVMLVLAAGAVFVGALYWGLLNTPEANPITLGLSAFIVVTMLTAAGVTVNTAIVVAQGVPVREGLRRAPRGIGWFLVAIVPLVVAWIAIVRGDRWVADHQGELNAWFIARLGWADISRLLQTEVWTSRWLRWTVLPVAALSLLATLLGDRPGAPTAWLRRAFHWRTLLADVVVFVLLFALPWRLTAWRPAVPPTWIEPTVAGLRLAAFILLALGGAAIMVLTATGDRPRDRTRPEAAPPGVE